MTVTELLYQLAFVGSPRAPCLAFWGTGSLPILQAFAYCSYSNYPVQSLWTISAPRDANS
jgi:hypothetical protein